jgi:O-antigen/teichoic acid export membrane protein
MDKILKIYFWRIITLTLSIVSFLIIIPRLSSSQNIFGLYSSILYLLLFISFNDFGFLPASIKYASEAIGLKDRNKEMSVISFSMFVMVIFTLITCLFFLYLSFNPSFFFSELNSQEILIAERLYFGLAIFSPFYALKRSLQTIYQIRVEDFRYQISEVFFIILKICFVFVFFNEGKYEIVEYFYTYNLIYIVIVGLLFIDIKIRYKYDWLLFFKGFKFDKNVYRLMKKLSFAMLFSSVAAILLYQFDMIAISSMFSAKTVGIFAIGLTITSYLRNIIGSIYQPYTAILNQHYGKGEFIKFDNLLFNLFKMGTPFIFTLLSVSYIYSEILILSWVGTDYKESIFITKILILSLLSSSIVMPIAEYFKAYNLSKKIKLISFISPFTFYLSVFTFYFFTDDVNSFAYGRLVDASISCILFVLFYLKIKKTKIKKFLIINYKSILVISPFIYLTNYGVKNLLIIENSLYGTLRVVFFASITLLSLLTIIILFDNFIYKKMTVLIKKANLRLFKKN